VTSGDDPLLGPEIAIVTITKDDPGGIKKTLASVEQQEPWRYEHVVVDGGSNVEVAALLSSWRDAMPDRRTLLTDPPAGIYPSMNAGIQRTTAPLVLMLNGGDELVPGALQRVSDHHRLHEWRWAYGGVQARDLEGRLRDEYTFAPFSRRALRAGVKPIPHQAAYVTRELYQEAGLYREDLGTAADQEFFLRISRLADPGVIPGIIAVVEEGGLSSHETFLGREAAWHRLRVASGSAFGGHRSTDTVLTGLLLVRLFVIRIAAKLVAFTSHVSKQPGSDRE
jgi:glycosyltransferase involved in cell wall biosynthesis